LWIPMRDRDEQMSENACENMEEFSEDIERQEDEMREWELPRISSVVRIVCTFPAIYDMLTRISPQVSPSVGEYQYLCNSERSSHPWL
jgi:hypothetical protein